MQCPEYHAQELELSEWDDNKDFYHRIYYCDLCKTGFKITIGVIKE